MHSNKHTATLMAGLAVTLLASSSFAASPIAFKTADETFTATFSFQYRPRFETNDGKDFVDGATTEFISHRARLGVKLNYKSNIEGFVQLQDVRKWGEETNTLTDFTADGLDLHQGYGKLSWDNGVGLKVGRQEIAWDNERIVGKVNWAQQGRSFDAVLFSYGKGKSTFSAGYAKLVENDTPAKPAADWDLGLLRFESKPTDAFSYSINAVYDAVAKEGMTKRFTIGPYLNYKANGWNVTADLYYQGGELNEDVDISAYFAGVKALYTFDSSLKPTLGVLVDYLSGDDDPADDTFGSFNTLFATNHAFYGYADIFAALPADTRNLGLIDAAVRFGITPGKVALTLDGHYFLAAQDTPGGERDWGTEFDFTLQTTWWEYVTFHAGASVFLPGKAMEELRGDETETFSYLMLDISL